MNSEPCFPRSVKPKSKINSNTDYELWYFELRISRMALILANLDLWTTNFSNGTNYFNLWALSFAHWTLCSEPLTTTNFSNGTNYLAIRFRAIRGIRSAVLVVYELTSYLWLFLKLKRLYNRAHRATERMEIKAMSRRWGWHKERGR